MQQSVRDGKSGDVIAVVSQSGPTVSFFDVVSDEHLETIELLAEPHELCFDATKRMLWCANTYHSGYYHDNGGRRNEVTLIDPDARKIIDVIDLAPEHAPHGLALDAQRNRLYVSVEGAADREGGVVVIDTDTRRVVDRFSVGAPGPHWFVVSPDGTAGYASNKEAPFLSVVDLDTGALTAQIEVPGGEGLAVSADGRRVFVAAPYAAFEASRPDVQSGVRVIDTAAGSVIDALPTDTVAVPVHLTSTGKVLAGEVRMLRGSDAKIQGQSPGQLTVFCADDGQRLGSVEIGRCPLTITSSPDGRIGYAACVIDSTVDVIDLERIDRLARLNIPKLGEPGAHGMAYIPWAS